MSFGSAPGVAPCDFAAVFLYSHMFEGRIDDANSAVPDRPITVTARACPSMEIWQQIVSYARSGHNSTDIISFN